jgi:hypothetical protein
MPEVRTVKRARKLKRKGQSANSQAGAFVHEQIKKIRRGAHGARSAKQAIAIGLNEARRAGVKLKPPKKGTVSEKTRKSAESAYEKGRQHKPVSKKRSRAAVKALKKEGKAAVSHKALSKQARSAAKKRSASDRSAAAKKAARTKGRRNRSTAAKKAARTRAKASR